MAKVAPALKKFLEDANLRWPGRSRVSDGTIGDAAHAKRPSDHNPDASGYVHAVDITHDPAHGVNCDVLAGQVIHDPRVKYVIWEGKIWKARTRGWDVYRGPNPHNHHMHVSINANATHDVSPWPWSPPGAAGTPETAAGLPILKLQIPMMRDGQGGLKEQVTLLQKRLVFHGIDVATDGVFGYNTSKAVRLFQANNKLKIDGEVGPNTWKALLPNK